MRPIAVLVTLLLFLLSTYSCHPSSAFSTIELLYQRIDDNVSAYTHVVIGDGSDYVLGFAEGYLAVSRVSLVDSTISITEPSFHYVASRRIVILSHSYEDQVVKILAFTRDDDKRSITLYFLTFSEPKREVSIDASIVLPEDFEILHGSIYRGVSVIAGLYNESLVVARISLHGIEWVRKINIETPQGYPISACVIQRRDGSSVSIFTARDGLGIAYLSPTGSVMRLLVYNTTTPVTVYDCRDVEGVLFIAGGINIGTILHPILVYMTLSEPMSAGHSIVGDLAGVFSSIASSSLDKLYALIVTSKGTLLARYEFSIDGGFKLKHAVNLTSILNDTLIGSALGVTQSTIIVAGALMEGKGGYIAVVRDIEFPRLSSLLAPAIVASAAIVLIAVTAMVVIALMRRRKLRSVSQMD